MKVLEERRRERLRVVKALEEYASKLREKLGPITLILYGSYARGDFNLWSDIDVIIVSKAFEEVRYLDRWKLLPPAKPPLDALEPVTWAPSEAEKMLSKPAWRKALEKAIIIADDLSVSRLLPGKQHTAQSSRNKSRET